MSRTSISSEYLHNQTKSFRWEEGASLSAVLSYSQRGPLCYLSPTLSLSPSLFSHSLSPSKSFFYLSLSVSWPSLPFYPLLCIRSSLSSHLFFLISFLFFLLFFLFSFLLVKGAKATKRSSQYRPFLALQFPQLDPLRQLLSWAVFNPLSYPPKILSPPYIRLLVFFCWCFCSVVLPGKRLCQCVALCLYRGIEKSCSLNVYFVFLHVTRLKFDSCDAELELRIHVHTSHAIFVLWTNLKFLLRDFFYIAWKQFR